MLQEEENLKVAVEQLAALKPDVLLVERSVGRFAQGLLLEKGIALALNVKGSLLNRLSRCTGAKVRRLAPMQPMITVISIAYIHARPLSCRCSAPSHTEICLWQGYLQCRLGARKLSSAF